MTAAVLLLCLLAPAPKDRPPPALVPSSTWMLWHGIECETHWHRDGQYSCLWAGRWWHGRWKCEGGTLTVEEWPGDDERSRSAWSVRLSSPDAGVMGGRSAWRVRPLTGGRVY